MDRYDRQRLPLFPSSTTSLWLLEGIPSARREGGEIGQPHSD